VPSSSSISIKRRRQIFAVLLSAFALLSAASVATFHRPGLDAEFWESPNACGPVGAGLAWVLAWAFGHAAAFMVPVAAAFWAWNRLRDEAAGPLLLKSALAALLVFEVCVLLALGGVDRWNWSGGWGLAASLALQASLGVVGSWVVASALLLASTLAASELGFHWIEALMHGALVKPAQGAIAAYGTWQDTRAEQARLAAKERAKEEKAARKRPAKAALAEEDEEAEPDPAPPPPRISSGRAEPARNGPRLPGPNRCRSRRRPRARRPPRRCRRSRCSSCPSSRRTWSPPPTSPRRRTCWWRSSRTSASRAGSPRSTRGRS
jgi:hypothetical protein